MLMKTFVIRGADQPRFLRFSGDSSWLFVFSTNDGSENQSSQINHSKYTVKYQNMSD